MGAREAKKTSMKKMAPIPARALGMDVHPAPEWNTPEPPAADPWLSPPEGLQPIMQRVVATELSKTELPSAMDGTLYPEQNERAPSAASGCPLRPGAARTAERMSRMMRDSRRHNSINPQAHGAQAGWRAPSGLGCAGGNVRSALTLAAAFSISVLCGGCSESNTSPASAPIAFSTCFGEVGMSPGQFSYPRAIDSDGECLWIIDKAARVQRIDPRSGSVLSGWRMPEWTGGKPTGITIFSPTGGTPDDLTIFVADTHYNRIMVYQPGPTILAPGERDPGNDGTAWGSPVHLIAKFGSYGTEPGQLTYPTDVAVLPTDDGTKVAKLYVSEYGGTDRISIFEPSPTGDDSTKPAFTCVATFGRFGSSSDPAQVEFSRPQSMVIDALAAELIVADACNHRIGRFHLDGRLIAWIGSPDSAGKGLGQFSYPYGLALLEDRTVLVAEYGNNRIQQVDLDTGKGVRTFGQPGRGSGQLAIPWGIAAIGSTAYVLDSGNNRVMGFDAPRPARRLALDPDRVKGDG